MIQRRFKWRRMTVGKVSNDLEYGGQRLGEARDAIWAEVSNVEQELEGFGESRIFVGVGRFLWRELRISSGMPSNVLRTFSKLSQRRSSTSYVVDVVCQVVTVDELDETLRRTIRS